MTQAAIRLACIYALAFTVAFLWTTPASAARTCNPTWELTFGNLIVGRGINTFATFDDGSGPSLYAGFSDSTIDGVTLNGISRWDGQTWVPVGGGVMYYGHPGEVLTLTVLDDGSGHALFAGGVFNVAGDTAANGIAKWDGKAWSPVGDGVMDGDFSGFVYSMTTYDDGDGPAIYAGGVFTRAGGQPAENIARWNGNTWSPVGSGISGAAHSSVRALAVFDDGGGALLYAGGSFTTADGFPVNNIAKWDGETWSPLGSGVSGNDFTAVFALTAYDDGNGSQLYAGGFFTTAGSIAANYIATWDGTNWSSPVGLDGPVLSLSIFDDGSGSSLFVGGLFSSVSGSVTGGITKWQGGAWSILGYGYVGKVQAFGSFAHGEELYLYAATSYGQASYVIRWDGTSLSSLRGAPDSPITAMAVATRDTESSLYVGGMFLNTAGGVPAGGVAQWDGGSWMSLGSGVDGIVDSLAVSDDGVTQLLYVGGLFSTAGGAVANSVAMWDGAHWLPLGEGVSGGGYGRVFAMTVYPTDATPLLYVGGAFFAAGGVSANSIAVWDGAAWSPLGTGINGQIYALTVFDDGTGPSLYAGGWFFSAGGVPVYNIARWDGAEWSAVGSGINGRVSAMTVFEDGQRSALYVGGSFSSAGGVPVNNVARWDGAEWSAVGSGIDGTVNTMTVFEDGQRSSLYVGGSFSSAGGVSVNNIARWDGSEWFTMGNGTNGAINSLAALYNRSRPSLYVGGWFTSAGGLSETYIAKWQGCAASIPCPGDTNGDGVVNFTDLNAVLTQFGQSVAPGSGGDVTGDGVVNFSDLNEVLSNFGNACN